MKKCSGCQTPMTEGWYCCGELYCSKDCLDKSFEGTGENWDQHYEAVTNEDGDSGECYRTQWEVDIARDFKYRSTISGAIELYATVDGDRTVFKYASLDRARKHFNKLRKDGAGYLLISDESRDHLWRNLVRQAIT